jgi:membrane-bound ClpP family serine protease
MTRTRLIVAIVTTLADEAAIVALVVWGLPRLGIHIPLPGLIVSMLGLAALSVLVFRKGSRALRRKPVIGLSTMVGSKAKVVRLLSPDGMIRIKGELWKAVSSGETINAGEEVTVVGQEGLKLIVRKSNPGEPKEWNDRN